MSDSDKQDDAALEKFPPFKPTGKKIQHRDPREMTAQEKQVADSVLANPKKPIKKLAKDNGLTVAKTNKILALPQVNEYLAQEMTAAGLTLRKGLEAIKDGLEAKKVQYFQKDGEVTDERVVVDHTTRLHAAELDVKLHGFLQPQVIAPSQTNIAQIVVAIKEERARRGLPPIYVPLPSNGHQGKNNGHADYGSRI